MSKSFVTKFAVGAGVLIAAGVIIANLGGNPGSNGEGAAVEGNGFDVSTVDCNGIEDARAAVNTELAERKSAVAETLAENMEKASDNYWGKRRALDEEKSQCESDANLADPCKEAFEEISKLYEEIMAEFRAGNGFNEAKFNEREQAKKDYNDCVENPPREATYAGKMEACLQSFNTANEQALQERNTEEDAAQKKHDDAVKDAEADHKSKMDALDALEKECEETFYERTYGNLPGTGIPVTDYQGGSSACTGIFPGYDPERAKQIANLRSQHNKAEAAGKREGFMGTIHLSEAIRELEKEMADGSAKCETDADCGGPDPVCCNVHEVGRAFCDGGTCSNEKTMCGADEVCAGKPAQCLGLVQVIEYQGSLIPTAQLRISGTGEENCKERHWHGSGTALDGKSFTDPMPDGCGYGTLTERPAFNVYPPSQSSSSGAAAPGGGRLEVRGGIFGD